MKSWYSAVSVIRKFRTVRSSGAYFFNFWGTGVADYSIYICVDVYDRKINTEHS